MKREPVVSIPLRKVSRWSQTFLPASSLLGFHPSKEGFKASTWGVSSSDGGVSIPLRKVSRAVPSSLSRLQQSVSIPLRKVSRHKLKIFRYTPTIVSIPLRKVSRTPNTLGAYRSRRCFHPSKEGFKAGPLLRRRVLERVSIPLRKVSRRELVSFSRSPR